MKTRFLANPPLVKGRSNPANVRDQQRSPYYWWWAYLRRNADYLACCENGGTGKLARLYKDFGDVRRNDFNAWWGGKLQRGPTLFAEAAEDLQVQPLDSPSHGDPAWGPGRVLVVAVGLQADRRSLLRPFGAALGERRKSRIGRPAPEKLPSTARYPLHGRAKARSLKMMLDAYDAWQANLARPASRRLPMWRIGESLNLVPSAMLKPRDSSETFRLKKNVMTVTMSRYVKLAKNIIANTARGQFPNSEV